MEEPIDDILPEKEIEDEEGGPGAADYTMFMKNTVKLSVNSAAVRMEQPKDHYPDYTLEQQALIERANKAMIDIISEPRSCAIKSACEGFWLNDKQLAVVTKTKGNQMNTLGFSADKGRLYLHPIECLYMFERGSLILYGPSQLSHRAVFSLTIKSTQDLEKYLIYAYLKRLGYVVRIPEEDQRIIQDDGEFYSTPCVANDGICPEQEELLERFRLVKTKKATKTLEIDFIVYKPGSGFSKRNPGQIDFYVKVCSFSREGEFMQVSKFTHKQLKLAIICNGSISFLGNSRYHMK